MLGLLLCDISNFFLLLETLAELRAEGALKLLTNMDVCVSCCFWSLVPLPQHKTPKLLNKHNCFPPASTFFLPSPGYVLCLKAC